MESKGGVTVHACKVDNTEKATWFTEYLVDCSGGKSFTRKRLKIDYVGDVQMKGAHWAGQFYNVWLRIPELNPKYLGHRRAWMNWAVNEDSETRGVLVALNGNDEYLLMVKPGVAKDGLDEDKVKSWVSKSIGADIDIEILAYAPWTAGAALAVETYKVGRIFLAGDSAHLFTPVGAFGKILSCICHTGIWLIVFYSFRNEYWNRRCSQSLLETGCHVERLGWTKTAR